MPDAAVVFAPSSPLGKRIAVGGATFSTIPTIAEINASSDWNQCIALYNRRISQIYDSPPAGLYYLSTSTGEITATAISALRNAINALRASCGLSAYGFGASLASGTIIKALHLTDIRAALAEITGVVLIPMYQPGQKFTRVDNPYGTPSSSSYSTTGGSTGLNPPTLGQSVSGSTWTRIRYGISFPVPAQGFKTSSTCSFGWAVRGLSPPTLRIYSSTADNHTGPTSWETDLSVLESTVTPPAFNSSWSTPVSLANVNAKAGGYISYVIGTQKDFTNTNPGSSEQLFNVTVPVLVLDFGF